MAMMKYLLCTSFLLMSCEGSEPAAATYKKQLSSSNLQSGNQTPSQPDPAAGKTFFISKSCSGCHGEDGNGGTKINTSVDYDTSTFAEAKALTPAHDSSWPSGASDTANVIAYLNSLQ